jgi:hypothetical protein
VLIAVAAEHPEILREMLPVRPLLVETMSASRTALQRELEIEMRTEMQADAEYWRPLRKELESMQFEKRKRQS